MVTLRFNKVLANNILLLHLNSVIFDFFCNISQVSLTQSCLTVFSFSVNSLGLLLHYYLSYSIESNNGFWCTMLVTDPSSALSFTPASASASDRPGIHAVALKLNEYPPMSCHTSPSGSTSPSSTPSILFKGTRHSYPSPWPPMRSPPFWSGRCALYSPCPTEFSRINVFCSKASFLIIISQISGPTWWERISLTHPSLLLKLMRSGSHPPSEVWTLYPPLLHLLLVLMIPSTISTNVLSLALLPMLLLVLLLHILQLCPPVPPPTSTGIIVNTVIRLGSGKLANGQEVHALPAGSSNLVFRSLAGDFSLILSPLSQFFHRLLQLHQLLSIRPSSSLQAVLLCRVLVLMFYLFVLVLDTSPCISS